MSHEFTQSMEIMRLFPQLTKRYYGTHAVDPSAGRSCSRVLYSCGGWRM